MGHMNTSVRNLARKAKLNICVGNRILSGMARANMDLLTGHQFIEKFKQ